MMLNNIPDEPFWLSTLSFSFYSFLELRFVNTVEQTVTEKYVNTELHI